MVVLEKGSQAITIRSLCIILWDTRPSLELFTLNTFPVHTPFLHMSRA